MPLYEFKCRGCEHTWEVKLAYREPYPDCPVCGESEPRKVFAPPALIFKGSGWHQNDYGKHGAKSNGANGSDKKASAATEASPPPAPATESAAESTAKPATKAEAK